MSAALYLDMDGVLADFEGKVAEILGMPGRRYEDCYGHSSYWSRLEAYPDFFNTFEPLPDASELWEATKHLSPTILTGSPHGSDFVSQKRSWIRRHLGDVPVVCCKSHEKSSWCRPGDILVDDHTKYRHLWMARGGHFIVHTDARTTLLALTALGIPCAALKA